MKKTISFITIFLFGFYGLKLFFEQHVVFYINKKYEPFLVMASALCVTIGIIGIYLFIKDIRRKKSKKSHPSFRKIFSFCIGYLPIFVALLAGFFLPVEPLSSSYYVDFSNLPVLVTKNTISLSDLVRRLGSDTTKYSFIDWIKIRTVDGDFSFRNGKKVKISGMLVKQDGLPNNIFFVTKYVITCCVLDAQPYGFAVELEDWQENFKQNNWIEVNGHFESVVMDGEEKLLIKADSINKIPVPKEPYINYFDIIKY